jgi:hypothetical protein
MGDGAFIKAMVATCRRQGIAITDDMTSRLFGYDIDVVDSGTLVEEVFREHGVILDRANFLQRDAILDDLGVKFDLLIGNPPWVNFTRLPADYKETLKPMFRKYGLVTNARTALLGSSRIDIAALVVSRMIADVLNPHGRLMMFLPSSLFDGAAHEHFRDYHSMGHRFALDVVFDFENKPIFSESNTPHGTAFVFAIFTKSDAAQAAPDRYVLEDPNGTEPVWKKESHDPVEEFDSAEHGYRIRESSKPRQGLNTAGANSIYFGDIVSGDLDCPIVTFRNGLGIEAQVESALLFPLIMRENIKQTHRRPCRYVIIPHARSTGKPLTVSELGRYPGTAKYFEAYADVLRQRRGTLIRALIASGRYWGLMGVGPYSFSAEKVVWLTAGESTFAPQVFSHIAGQPWQANQALQAYIPVDGLGSGDGIAKGVKACVEQAPTELLGRPKSLGWAQPGRVKKVLAFY